ncbi:uncharacterized protein LOC135683293 isoform X2 [Rhopilema esculentum]|uniref:uncharacterized protein LOC135683293 isoform X2 n=1 Tax=Rhopilema esculentum TaxID=499914 RepID=UPI0031D1AB98
MAGAELENCAFRAKQLIQANDRNLVDGRASFKAVDEISDLPFTVAFSSPYICKYCVTILKKRHSFRLKLKDIDKVLKNRYNSVSLLQVKSNTLEEPAVKIRLVGSSFCSTPLSKKHAFTQTNKCNFILKSSNKNQENLPFQQKANALNYPKVSVEVEWQNETRRRELCPSLNPVGKMLLRGTFKQIAAAAWRCDQIRPYMITQALKVINKECAVLCARKSPSMLRAVKKDDIVKFSFMELNKELKQKCPLLHAVIKTACLRKCDINRKTGLINEETGMNQNIKWIQPLCMAVAICAKTRSSHLSGLQLIISIILQHCSLTAAIARLRVVKLTVSHPCLHKKLDEFGKLQDSSILEQVSRAGEMLSSKRDLHEETIEKDQEERVVACRKLPDFAVANKGWKIVLDNIDYQQNVHHMSEEHQNSMFHWVTYMTTQNRVSGNDLRSEKPPGNISELEYGKFLPNKIEHKAQRDDYVFLVARLCSTHIPCRQFLLPTLKKHIKRRYTDLTNKPTQTTFHGCIYENENDSDGIQKVLHVLHELVPKKEMENEKLFAEQGVVGDQLSVERGVNCLLELSNGFTKEERLEGLHFEIADFQAAMKFLQLGFDNFYSGSAASDHCTL